MPECDFVDIVVDKLELFMPKFIGVYRRDELIGNAWSSELLLRHITNIAAKGNFKIEEEARHEHSVATNRLRLHQQEQRDYERENNHWERDVDDRWEAKMRADQNDRDWEYAKRQMRADDEADDTSSTRKAKTARTDNTRAQWTYTEQHPTRHGFVRETEKADEATLTDDGIIERYYRK
jgi:hypothetical protein